MLKNSFPPLGCSCLDEGLQKQPVPHPASAAAGDCFRRSQSPVLGTSCFLRLHVQQEWQKGVAGDVL